MVPDSCAPPVMAPTRIGARRLRTEKFGGQVDIVQVGLGQRVIGQPVALKAGRQVLIADVTVEAHVDVAAFAGGQLDAVGRHD